MVCRWLLRNPRFGTNSRSRKVLSRACASPCPVVLVALLFKCHSLRLQIPCPAPAPSAWFRNPTLVQITGAEKQARDRWRIILGISKTLHSRRTPWLVLSLSRAQPEGRSRRTSATGCFCPFPPGGRNAAAPGKEIILMGGRHSCRPMCNGGQESCGGVIRPRCLSGARTG